MTAVDHAELKRVAEGATDDAVKRIMAELEYRESRKIKTLGGIATADLRILVNEASGHIDALVSALRTQAPDSWGPIAEHDGSREPVLLIGLYRDGKTWSDIYHGWWQPPYRGFDGEEQPGAWARWPHPFPPTHFAPALRPQTAESGE